MLEKLLSFLVAFLQDFRRVRFRSHRAFFATSDQEHVFLTVTNLSRSREIEVTHVWLELSPQVATLPPQRPLPKRLRPDEVWETWIPLAVVPTHDQSEVLKLGRLRLSTGRVVKATPDKNMPFEGAVPGGASTKPRL
jgi:hypothetical protein